MVSLGYPYINLIKTKNIPWWFPPGFPTARRFSPWLRGSAKRVMDIPELVRQFEDLLHDARRGTVYPTFWVYPSGYLT
jgi:hypothetical protein